MDFEDILKHMGDEGRGAGIQQLLKMFADERGNDTNMRLVENTLDHKVKKVVKDLSAFKLTYEDDKTGKSRDKALSLFKEKARALAARSKYYEATALFEEMDMTDESVDLGTKLLMAVCYLQLGRENKANKSIKSIRQSLLRNPTLEADELLELIDSLEDSNSHTGALILLPVASKLYKRKTSEDEVLDGLFRCIEKANGCTRPMLSEGGRARVLAIDFGMDFMLDTLNEMKELTGVDAQKLAFKQCLSTTLIAYDFWVIKENHKGVRLREDAIMAMDKAFGHQQARQRRIYGNTLYNIGVGYDILGKHSKAKEAYEKAIEAIESATDYDDEARRQTDSRMCKQKLKELHI